MESCHLSDVDFEPHEDFYFKVMAAHRMVEKMSMPKELVLKFCRITERDYNWAHAETQIPSTFHGATDAEYEEVWAKIKESYEAHIQNEN